MSYTKLVFRFLLRCLCAAVILPSFPALGATLHSVETIPGYFTAPGSLKSLLAMRGEVSIQGVGSQRTQRYAAAGTTATDAGVTVGELSVSCISNFQCDASSYCAKPFGLCDAIGTCTAKPQVCIALYDPVCGCNGVTYGNSCDAAGAGVSVASRGPCSSACPVVDFAFQSPNTSLIVVFGSNLAGATGVSINGVEAPVFGGLSNDILWAFIPPGVTKPWKPGTVQVTTPVCAGSFPKPCTP